MKLATISRITLGILALHAAGAQAETAGRVLAAVGDTVALRKGQEIRLVVGATVETGDTLRVGEASNLQVRFTDEAIVALRPNTIFRIDDYAFADKAETDKSIFSLLKGGLRTITGFIGQRSRGNYAVRSETSTIGIRGTHWAMVSCKNDCKNADGSEAPNGTYGGVTDGRIVAANKAGEREFGKDEYFYVASLTELPQMLLAPPTFLRDRLEGQTRAPGKGSTTGGKESAKRGLAASAKISSSLQRTEEGTTEVTGGARTGSTEQQAVIANIVSGPDIPPPPPPPSNVVLDVNNSAAWASAGKTAAGVGAGAAAEQIYLTANYPANLSPSEVMAGIVPPGQTGHVGANPLPFIMFAAASSGATTMIDFLKGAASWSEGSYYDHKSASTDIGFNASAGNTTWGRYYEEWSDSYGVGKLYNHWAVGDPVASKPTSGLYAYNWVGGTQPTDQDGKAGLMIPGSTLSVDFSSLKISTLSPITWSMPSGTAYKVTFTDQPLVSATEVQSNQYVSISSNVYQTIDATATSSCSGQGCLLYRVDVAPKLTGAQADGLGLGIGTVAARDSGVIEGTASVQVYKRGEIIPPPAPPPSYPSYPYGAGPL